ncbi:hypothetical protein CBR_g44355 [Chara braunii]|uniref:Peptidase A1 domain-containing protein n=1 Tax=Chara braunii TaxID=69332 RepID=A0A388K347_CHABU|nr:hypothetical protein CBR_g44355 [Chara braunii]|eukprot:GBG64470.1 hypothetical protein CBR_g44355 [Chara braunii]
MAGFFNHSAGGVSSRPWPLRAVLLALVAGMSALLAGEVSCVAVSPPNPARLHMKVKAVQRHVGDWRPTERRRLSIFDDLLSAAPIEPPAAPPSDSGDDGGSAGISLPSTSPATTPAPDGSEPGGGSGGGGGSVSSLASPSSSPLISVSSLPPPSSQRPGMSSRFKSDLILRSILKWGFAADVLVGTPAQVRALEVSFADFVTWTFCSPAMGETPLNAPNPLFSPDLSATAMVANCTAHGCLPIVASGHGFCHNASCLLARYSGSEVSTNMIMGVLISDLMMLKNENASLVRFDSLSCVLNLNGSYVNRTSDGVLALGPSEGTYFAALQREFSLPDVLSFCFNASGFYQRLSSRSPFNAYYDGGSLVLGTPPDWVQFPSPLPVTPLTKSQVSKRTPYAQYMSRLVSWSIGLPPSGSTVLATPGSDSVFFSSEAVTYLPSSSFATLLEAFVDSTTMQLDGDAEIPIFNDATSAICDVSVFPVLSFTFQGGQVLIAKPEEYAIFASSSSDGCTVLLPFTSTGETVDYFQFGTSLLQSKWVTFDFSAGTAIGALKIGSGPCSESQPMV